MFGSGENSPEHLAFIDSLALLTANSGRDLIFAQRKKAEILGDPIDPYTELMRKATGSVAKVERNYGANLRFFRTLHGSDNPYNRGVKYFGTAAEIDARAMLAVTNEVMGIYTKLKPRVFVKK